MSLSELPYLNILNKQANLPDTRQPIDFLSKCRQQRQQCPQASAAYFLPLSISNSSRAVWLKTRFLGRFLVSQSYTLLEIWFEEASASNLSCYLLIFNCRSPLAVTCDLLIANC
ncbi:MULTISPECIES: hypothetical protein [unclassified Microcoleus]|uniref:hypothetical protein n=1 Tax=unclassified Microcoleus TaxID=2642155 RepID=UPI0025D6B2CD|nr:MULTISPECIES: hypothetical protein [unclassified Microcoleus]